MQTIVLLSSANGVIVKMPIRFLLRRKRYLLLIEHFPPVAKMTLM